MICKTLLRYSFIPKHYKIITHQRQFSRKRFHTSDISEVSKEIYIVPYMQLLLQCYLLTRSDRLRSVNTEDDKNIKLYKTSNQLIKLLQVNRVNYNKHSLSCSSIHGNTPSTMHFLF